MGRLPLIDPADLTGDLGEVIASLPVKLNVFRMMAHADTCAIPVMRLGRAILAKQQLGAVPRELLILQAAKIEGGEYEWSQHVVIGRGVGVTQGQIDAIERGDYTSSDFDEAEQALLAFGDELVRNVRVPAPVFAVMQVHYSAKEIVEAIIAVGFYMMLARLTEATETDLDEPGGMRFYDSTQKRRTAS